MSAIYFGLSPTEVRTLAYQCAVTYNIKVPNSWQKNEEPGPGWFTGKEIESCLLERPSRQVWLGCQVLKDIMSVYVLRSCGKFLIDITSSLRTFGISMTPSSQRFSDLAELW